MVKTIVGSFEDFTDAYRASADLMGAGFMAADINVRFRYARTRRPSVTLVQQAFHASR